MDELIKHDGVVTKVENGKVFVLINSQSACSGCHAKGACGGMDCLDKEIIAQSNETFEIGEQVKVCISNSLGLKALFWGYLLPFLILVGSIVVAINLGVTEDRSAVIGISATALYYLLLYPFRGKLSKQFQFKIERK